MSQVPDVFPSDASKAHGAPGIDITSHPLIQRRAIRSRNQCHNDAPLALGTKLLGEKRAPQELFRNLTKVLPPKAIDVEYTPCNRRIAITPSLQPLPVRKGCGATSELRLDEDPAPAVDVQADVGLSLAAKPRLEGFSCST